MGVSLAACSGFRIFLPLLITSISLKMGWVQIGSENFKWLTHNSVLVALTFASIIEFLAYLIPWLDHALDSLAAPLSFVVGTLLASAVAQNLPPELRYGFALIAGGGTAGAVQATTSLLRIGSTKFSGGLFNPIFTKIETLIALAATILTLILPLLSFLLFILFFYISFRFLRRMISRKSNSPIKNNELS